jgi:hypothetical protein
MRTGRSRLSCGINLFYQPFQVARASLREFLRAVFYHVLYAFGTIFTGAVSGAMRFF